MPGDRNRVRDQKTVSKIISFYAKARGMMARFVISERINSPKTDAVRYLQLSIQRTVLPDKLTADEQDIQRHRRTSASASPVSTS
jgi:cytoplasmic iron level regulating protein YaaA (DUF328/UPF0246 family)